MTITSAVTWFIRDLYKKIEILEDKLELKIESSVNKFKNNNNQYVDRNIEALEKSLQNFIEVRYEKNKSRIERIHDILKQRTLLAKARGENINESLSEITNFLSAHHNFIQRKYPMKNIDLTETSDNEAHTNQF